MRGAHALLLLLLLHAAVYAAVPSVGFVTDDFLWLADAGRDVDWAQHASSREPFGYLRPLFHVLLAVARDVFGLCAWPLHALALLASVAASALLFVALRTFTGNALAACVGACWLVVHPSQAIALAWISSLPSLLATALVLGALVCWQRFRLGGAVAFAWGSVALHLCAVLAKEEAVVMLLWLVVAERLLAGRVSPRGKAFRLAVAAHVLVAGGYLWAWWSGGGGGGAPYGPATLGDAALACLDPLRRLSPLLLPRHLVRWPFAELLVALALWWLWRRAAERRAATLLALGVAWCALLPSSVFLWQFGYDKMDRLLHPALPAACLLVAGLVAAGGWRAACVAAALLAAFAARSHEVVQRRVEDGDEARVLLRALQEHEGELRRLAGAGAPVRVVDYPATWVYPAAVAQALAPGLEVRIGEGTPDDGATTLRWAPDSARFVR